MKCLLLTYEYPPFKGGIAAYLANLVAEKGKDIEVAVKVPPSGEHWAITSLRLLFGRDRYDAVIVSHALPAGYIAVLLKALRGMPYAVIAHGTDILSARRMPRRRRLLRLVLGHALAIVANSRFTAGLLKEEGVAKIEIVPPGVPSRPPLQRSGTDAGNAIISIGRLVPRKGFDTLIKAMPAVIKEVPGAAAKIIGRGDYYDELVRLAHELRVEIFVELVTNASDDDKTKALSEAEVFVLAARETGFDVEGFGIAALEASAMGLPVIAGRSGGAPETVVNGVTGIIIEPDDPKSLADALIRLLKNPEEARKMGEEGRKYVNHEYSAAKSAERFWEIMRQSLSSRLSGKGKG